MHAYGRPFAWRVFPDVASVHGGHSDSRGRKTVDRRREISMHTPRAW